MTPEQLKALRPYIKGIVWHWTAGPWQMTFKKYHLNHTWDDRKKEAHTIQTLSLWKPGEHVWKRNTGQIGMTLCGMWRHPITRKFHNIQAAQIEQMADRSAQLVWAFNLDPDTQVRDHVYYATLDGYGPGSGNPETRVDIGPLEPIVRRKMMVYLRRYERGLAEPTMLDKLK